MLLQLYYYVRRRLSAVHFKRFPNRNPEALQQLLARGFLVVDARDFLDLADPPFARFLYNS